MAENLLYQESIDFISNNIDAQNSDIPKYLLEFWFIPELVDDIYRNSYSLIPYLCFLHAFKTYYQTLGIKREVSLIEEVGRFEQFQLIIRTELGKEKLLKIQPVNLFDFENYSKLNIS